jgi:hypothetical protein
MSNDFFANYQKQVEADNRVSQQAAFQERIVKQLLRYAGVQLPPLGVVKSQAKQQYGSTDLNFHWFDQEYGFPVKLMAQKMPFTHKATLADLYGQGAFKKLPWWKEYEEQVEGNQYDLNIERAALIFNLPHARDAFLMVLHNQPTQAGVTIADAELREDQPWPRTTFPVGKSGVVAVLESFKSFMQTVGTEWAQV